MYELSVQSCVSKVNITKPYTQLSPNHKTNIVIMFYQLMTMNVIVLNRIRV